jgi:hypothetical protein
MTFFRYVCVLLSVGLVGCAAGPHGGPVFIPWEFAKAGVHSLREPHYKSNNEPPVGHSYKNAIPVRDTATREATTAFEDDWTYREMQSFHDQLPPLIDYSPKVQRVTERQGKKVFDVVTPPCPKGNVHIFYFDVTGTPLN